MEIKTKFSAADFAVFFISFGLCLMIGIVFAVRERSRNTTVNYFLANRNYRILPLALSFVITFQSSLLILGFPAEAYAYGISIGYFCVGVISAYTFTAIFIVPVLHPLQLTSVYSYFRLRYGNNVLRYMALVIGITYNMFYMAVITVGTCVAIDVVIGIPYWATILIYTALTSIYTSIGGIKAVIWTDVFQLVVMVSGIIAVLVKSSVDAGGAKKVFEHSGDRLKTDFRIDPTIRFQFWNVSFGTFSTMLNISLTQQAMQRVFSTPSARAARIMYFISGPMFALFLVMATFEGATIFAYYVEKGCDILEAGLIKNINAIIPFAILDLFEHQPGLAGLFTACLSSAALSTLSSCLSSLSAVTFEDVIKERFPNIHAHNATRVSKVIVVLYGLVTMVLAFVISKIPGTITAVFFSIIACIDGPMCAMFLLSIMCHKATTKGIAIGTFCGMAVSFWLNLGSKFSGVPPNPYLPPGPIDQCHKYTDTFSLYTNISSVNNITVFDIETPVGYSFTQALTLSSTTSSSTRNTGATELTILQKIYSISYILYSLIGLLTSLLVGLMVSLFTRAPEQYDRRCLFSFRKHVIGELCTNNLDDTRKEEIKFDRQELRALTERDVQL